MRERESEREREREREVDKHYQPLIMSKFYWENERLASCIPYTPLAQIKAHFKHF
jgi:hypothetical protein